MVRRGRCTGIVVVTCLVLGGCSGSGSDGSGTGGSRSTGGGASVPGTTGTVTSGADPEPTTYELPLEVRSVEVWFPWTKGGYTFARTAGIRFG